jgi:hypothetical protein
LHLPTKTLGRVCVLMLAGLTAYGVSDEQFGAAVANDVIRRNTVIESPYVQRLAEALTTQRYHITIIAENPGHRELLYFPGGFIIVPANMILRAQSETEFATMLAHAMAHIDRHHGFIPGSEGRIFFPGTKEGPQPLRLREFQRANEAEAAQLAASLTAALVESPNGEFQRFQDEIRSRLPKLVRRAPSLRSR